MASFNSTGRGTTNDTLPSPLSNLAFYYRSSSSSSAYTKSPRQIATSNSNPRYPDDLIDLLLRPCVAKTCNRPSDRKTWLSMTFCMRA